MPRARRVFELRDQSLYQRQLCLDVVRIGFDGLLDELDRRAHLAALQVQLGEFNLRLDVSRSQLHRFVERSFGVVHLETREMRLAKQNVGFRFLLVRADRLRDGLQGFVGSALGQKNRVLTASAGTCFGFSFNTSSSSL